ncbi:MAG: 16S rRNA (cytosine(1402)-N(4))-methyltransferase RsmH [Bacteroidia bacterium]|nr:16S rRNA (cytosine(1402)-N(4))-methyltransferase RsmH [Bacteroidia bacterium]MCF8428008.1 16S rRNA (cytosine(1402)-N(4))-methyltransferase RsmH [Bacteroidia bacterium]MCF8445732.1 16S rRNA (cytosine(1402)-N(4))-methyltransferase RsmH [Bacteroidia bacterium]
MENEESKPPRRVRYKGTHPKTFKEKYKELQPQKYAEDVKKVMEKGNTPAGMHRSICVNEIIEILQLKPGMIGLDATLGYGGHSLEILKKITPGGKLFATDVDPLEMPKTVERLKSFGFGEDVLFPRNCNFSQIDTIAQEAGLFQFVLADLGVSSMQIDNPERGFSLKVDGPLDLRLNPKSGIPASELLSQLRPDELEEILVANSDEPYAKYLSEDIFAYLQAGKKLETTFQLKELIKETLSFLPEQELLEKFKKTCQRCFQALRIEVNNEFGVLEEFLEKLPDAVGEGGRIAILSFHSGEDRRVKKIFKAMNRAGIYSEISEDIIRPSFEEISSNPRARSAKLRWAVK